MRRRQAVNVLVHMLAAAALLSAACGGGVTGVQTSRFRAPIVLKVNAASAPTRQYASIIQNQLKQVGIPCEIETVEFNTLLDQQRKGQFQLTTGRWVGGNQDPIYLYDLFRTGAYQNRGRYSNPELDKLLDEAIQTFDRAKAKETYVRAQEIISRELPQFPLWYVDQVVVARRNVQNLRRPRRRRLALPARRDGGRREVRPLRRRSGVQPRDARPAPRHRRVLRAHTPVGL